jgi:NAD(P)-dependent dehydrogenase (short-subunit alcohol dehydrogenase family)
LLPQSLSGVASAVAGIDVFKKPVWCPAPNQTQQSDPSTKVQSAASSTISKNRLAFVGCLDNLSRKYLQCDQGGFFVSLFDLEGKVAVITGSSRGIGRAIAERMAEHGAKVVISSRKAEPCQEVAAAINAKYGQTRAIAVPANISSKDQLQHLIDETTRVFGQVDVLVCNAASNPYYGPLLAISDDQFRKILDNNVVANNWLIGFVAPQMIARKDGAIIIISSIGGLKGNAIIGAYNISKAADFQLARNLAAELGPHNVRVNCIAPGLVRTDFARALWENPETLKNSTARTPLGRIGEPDEIAGAAILLASKAGTFMTGQTIVVDGGATIT